MDQYLEKGKELLKLLTKNGCEAYVIGEATRSEIMQEEPKEVEIVTSATPSMIKGIFSDVKFQEVSETSIKVIIDERTFLISTFRSDRNKKVRRRAPRQIYSKNLMDELSNREYTIDAIAMSAGGKFTDAYNGFNDIKNKLILPIGNPKLKLKDNPLAIFKAVRMYAELGFKVDEKIQSAVKKNAHLVKEINPKLYMDEIKRILNAKYYKRGLNLLHLMNPAKNIPLIGYELARLYRIHKTESFDDLMINSFVFNKAIDDDYLKFVDNEDFVKKVCNLAFVTPKSNYDNLLLFNYGLDVAIRANMANNLFGRARKKTRAIKKHYNKLPIKKPCDLEFKGDDLIELANGNNSDIITKIMEDIILKVLNFELVNDYDVIKAYGAKALQEERILPQIKEVVEEDNFYHEKLESNDEITKDDSEESAPQTDEIDTTFEVDEKKTPTYETPIYGNNCNNELDNPLINNNNQDMSPTQNAYTDYKISEMQREIAEVKKMLTDRDGKIASLERKNLESKMKADVEKLVSQNIKLLEDMKCITKETDKLAYERDLRKTYQDMLIKSSEYNILEKDVMNDEKN